MRIKDEKLDELWKKAKLAGARKEYLEYLKKGGKSGYDGGVFDLIDELVDIENIPEGLMKKISVVLGERWLRDHEMGNK